MKIAEKKSDIPKEKHYAILEQMSYYSDGGYPEDGPGSTYYAWNYLWTLDKNEWILEIKKRELEHKVGFKYNNVDYYAFESFPAKITVNIDVGVS